MHLNDTSDTLLLVLRRVKNIGTCHHDAGINSEEAELTDERVCSDLECESGERLFVRRRSLLFLIGLRVNTLDSGNVER